MIFYIFIIIVSLLLFNIAQINYKKNIFFILPYTAFILLLSILGGVRDDTVGIDMLVYGVISFENAKYSDTLLGLLKYVPGEWGFHTLMWLCAKISNDIHFMLFVEEFIKIILVSSTALHFKNKFNPTMFMFAYLTFFYFIGYNSMRQMLAISIFIYGLRFYFNNEHKKYIFTCLLAMTFHTSAIFALLIYVIRFIHGESFKSTIIIHLAIVLFVYLFSFTIMEYILSGNFGVYSEKADLYTEKEGVETAKTNILLAIMFFIISLFYKFWKKDKPDYIIFSVLLVYNLFFLLMSTRFEVAFRISWYQIPFILILYFTYVRFYKNGGRSIMNFLFILLFSLHFIISSIHGLDGTIPYTSKILGINV